MQPPMNRCFVLNTLRPNFVFVLLWLSFLVHESRHTVTKYLFDVEGHWQCGLDAHLRQWFQRNGSAAAAAAEPT